MSDKQAYIEKIQARLNQWDAKIQELLALTQEAQADAKVEYESQIAKLKEAQKDAQGKLDELRSSGEDAWKDMKIGVESAWERFETAANSAATRFSS